MKEENLNFGLLLMIVNERGAGSSRKIHPALHTIGLTVNTRRKLNTRTRETYES
jgi:hypothetical protein